MAAKASFVKNVNQPIASGVDLSFSSSSPSTPSSTSGTSGSTSGSSGFVGFPIVQTLPDTTAGNSNTGSADVPTLFPSNSPGGTSNTSNTSGIAPPGVSGTPNSNTSLINDQDVQTAIRLDPNYLRLGNSVRSGRIRTQEEDQINLFERQKIDIAASRVTATRAQSKLDIVRHRQKNQARCNHQFDISSGKCLWCNRKRTSQIYDS